MTVNPLGFNNVLPDLPVTLNKPEDEAPVISQADTFSAHSAGKTEASDAVKSFAATAPVKEKSHPTQVVYGDCYGQITHLGVQVDAEVTSDGNKGREIFGTLKTLFSWMEPDTKFTIVIESDRDKKAIEGVMKEIKMQNPERVHLLMAPYNITSWMRDNMVMTFDAQDPHQPIMIDKAPFQSHDDARLPGFIAKNTPDVQMVVDKILKTDGGDVVSDDKNAYVGYDSIYLTAMNLYNQAQGGGKSVNLMMNGLMPEEMTSQVFSKKVVFNDVPPHSHLPKFHLEDNPDYAPVKGPNLEQQWLDKSAEYFKGKYGKEIVVMGNDDPDTDAVEKPATFHIDMGVTPLDNNTVLVGSPQVAMDEISKWSKDTYKAANKSLQKETGLRGDILGKILDHNKSKDPNDPSVMRIQNNFESEAKALQAEGKNIIRLPYLEGNGNASTPWITYGNCIMQNFTRQDGTAVKNVFLPVYGIPLDDVAIKTYQSQGFEVIPLQLAAFTSLAGAIRCMSNYLGRSPAA